MFVKKCGAGYVYSGSNPWQPKQNPRFRFTGDLEVGVGVGIEIEKEVKRSEAGSKGEKL